jgi:hypothetical protein
MNLYRRDSLPTQTSRFGETFSMPEDLPPEAHACSSNDVSELSLTN